MKIIKVVIIIILLVLGINIKNMYFSEMYGSSPTSLWEVAFLAILIIYFFNKYKKENKK